MTASLGLFGFAVLVGAGALGWVLAAVLLSGGRHDG